MTEGKTNNGKSLVIVESPAKAKTINKYLGNGYIVKASMGHVRDLPTHKFGIDIENNFRPTYTILPGRKKIIQELKRCAENAKDIYLATDLDREGEAIAWHLIEALGIPKEKAKRVIFNEITKQAITEAFKNPAEINPDKVNAQQARRILDRIVGYQLSPLLWKKIAKKLSAGRVQSVAVKLIVDREKEIEDFKPEEYWKIAALLHVGEDLNKAKEAYERYIEAHKDKKDLKKLHKIFEQFNIIKADLVKIKDEPCKITNKDDALRIKKLLSEAEYTVEEINRKTREEAPPAPLTTAALQQQAATKLNFSAEKTMRIAQQLYEGVELGPEGSVALITYMRTDSTHLSNLAINAIRKFIKESAGSEYLPEKPNIYTPNKQAQQAHEAIRPTDINRRPEDVKAYLTADQYKLYDLIWRRTLASQAKPAKWQQTEIIIKATHKTSDEVFTLKVVGRQLEFEGFIKFIPERLTSLTETLLPHLKEKEALKLIDIEASQHFTQPPPRYTEASLVRTLESEGIGRPSTYATIISTIQKRGYVRKQNKRFYPTELGRIVTEQLEKHFPRIMDLKFTSHMEEQLDKIEEAHLDWIEVLKEFYQPFKEDLDKALQNMKKQTEVSEYKCPKCGRDLVYRWTINGRFLACSGYPKCQYSTSIDEEGRPQQANNGKLTDIKCPECKSPMVLRNSRYGRFLGCSRFPECKATIPADKEGKPLPKVRPDETGISCPECSSPMIARRYKGKAFLGCSRYPDCKTTLPIPEDIAIEWPQKNTIETEQTCPQCGERLVIRSSRRGRFLGCSNYPRCRYITKITHEKSSEEKKT